MAVQTLQLRAEIRERTRNNVHSEELEELEVSGGVRLIGIEFCLSIVSSSDCR